MKVALLQLACFLMLATPASAGMTELLRAVDNARAIEAESQDPAAEALDVMDKNQDGHIDPGEVQSYAEDEGIDPEDDADDLSGVDTNADGVMDSSGLLQVRRNEAANATTQDAAAAQKPPLSAAQQAAVASPPHVVTSIKGLAAEKPTSHHEPRISVQHGQSLRKAASTQNSQPPQTASAIRPAQTPPMPKPQVVEPPKPTPVDRMVRHFAQVLRNAEIIPMHEDHIKIAKNYVTSAAGYLHGDVPQVSVQSAAKEVAEQLFIAETAEARARVLDRKAAEGRANATVLAKLTTQEALNAGAAAAHQRANELLARIAKLEDQAERAQVRSAALHSKAKLETEEASELMDVADKALNRQAAGTQQNKTAGTPSLRA